MCFLAALWACFSSGGLCISSLFFTTGASHHSSLFWGCDCLPRRHDPVSPSFTPSHSAFSSLAANCHIRNSLCYLVVAFSIFFPLRERKGNYATPQIKCIKNNANAFKSLCDGLGGTVWWQRLSCLLPTRYHNGSHYPFTFKQVSHSVAIGGLTGDQMVREDKL